MSRSAKTINEPLLLGPGLITPFPRTAERTYSGLKALASVKLQTDAAGNLPLSGSVVATGELRAGQGVSSSGNAWVGGGLTVSGSALLADLSAATAGFAALSVSGATNLGSLTAGAATLNSLAVTGLASLPNLLVTQATLGSLTVTGSTSLQGGLAVTGSASLNGGLAVTGAVSLLSGASATGALTITALTGGRCLTLNSDAGATIFVNPLSGTQRAFLRLPSHQIVSDSLLNGTRDLIFQNLGTGRVPFQLGADDTVTLGTATTPVAVSGGLTAAKTTTLQSTLAHQGSQAGFFGASPVARPAVSGSVCGVPAVRTLAAALGSLGLVTDNTASTDPNATSFAWVNQGSASVTGGNGRVFLNAPASSGDALRLRVTAAPTGAYTLTVGLLPMAVNANFTLAGLCLYNSTSGGVVTFAYTNNSVLLANAPCITVSKWNSTGSFSANYTLSPATIPAANWQAGPCLWFQLEDNGVTRFFRLSNDGQNWATILSTANTDFITPDKVGFFANANSSLYGAGVTVVSWSVT